MTKSQALNRAIKLWGKGGCVRDSGVATWPDRRADARAALEEMGREYPEPRPGDDRTIAELRAWEQRGRDWRKQRTERGWIANQYRFAVGCVEMGLFFAVKGEGDTWEEAFAAAKQRGN